MTILPATRPDLPAILSLQYLAYQSEAILLQNFSIPPLIQTLADLEAEFESGIILKAVEGREIVGSVRARQENGTAHIGKLIVHPARQGKGIGTQLLHAIEQAAPSSRYELFTSSKSERNIRLYERAGYRKFAEKLVSPNLSFVYLEKRAGLNCQNSV